MCKLKTDTRKDIKTTEKAFTWVQRPIQGASRIRKTKTIQKRRIFWIERLLQVILINNKSHYDTETRKNLHKSRHGVFKSGIVGSCMD